MVQARSTLHEFMPYGAPDLLAEAATTRNRALAIAMLLWVAAFVLALGVAHLLPPATAPTPTVAFEILPDPVRPTHAPPMLPAPASRLHPGPIAPPRAIPIPVPDPMAHPTVTDPGPAAPAMANSPVEGTGLPGAANGPDLAPPVDRPDPGIWQLHDTEPELIRPVKPDYPELAYAARVEGTVYVQALVSREGTVSETIVRRGDPLLVDAAVQAARASRFRPAMANGHAVAVWVMMPFRFILH